NLHYSESCLCCFNPYCGGSDAGSLIVIGSSIVPVPGFNPYCGGSDAGSSYTSTAIQVLMSFQSLLWWIRRWKGCQSKDTPLTISVSILIVVDQTLEGFMGFYGWEYK